MPPAPPDSRPVDPARHAPGLDTLRVLAIVLVLGFHYPREGAPEWFAAAAGFGWAGVDLFFVLSGFLIGRQLLAPLAHGERPRLGAFCLRRLLRVLPAYWVVLAVYALVPGAREQEAMAPLWSFLTFTQNFGLEGGAFSHAWSLCIEEHFYLALPLLVLALTGRVRWRGVGVLVLGLVLLGIAVRMGLWWAHLEAPPPGASLGRIYRQWIYYPTWGRMDGLLAGVVLALVHTFRPALWRRWVRAPLGAALLTGVCLGLAGPLCAENKTLASSALVFPLLSLGFAALVVLALTDAGARVLGRLPGARWLAGVTYCVYLSHKLVIHAVHGVLAEHGMGAYHPVTLLVSVACVLAVAALLHLGVERPFLRLRERWGRPPVRQALAATA
ncbi:peptidoglycan/LPS O-acetylase OafA/YrhL [Archangium gephyra]|uniref:O-antigen acetylase n=1 Tax=Archangium gephyra TaxID=48 RepID=A0AAC8QCA7_9BACT|nr:acyltransferase [Archangium gephyra]AKJ04784.1 O-antigen acetylase [Archangium gephyra]REG37165.1 peptidoglycan/LPS O-acetylase OafA/YrhL [Archangium gephyra]